MIRFAVMMRDNVSGIGWHDRRRSDSSCSESPKSADFGTYSWNRSLKSLMFHLDVSVQKADFSSVTRAISLFPDSSQLESMARLPL